MASIVLPQAFRIIIPPLTNELVALIKDTSLVYVLGTHGGDDRALEVRDGTRSAETFNITPIIVAGLVYLAITLPLTRLVGLARAPRTAR